MAKISIEKAEPGMTVCKPVENDKGMVLLPVGTQLTEALIDRLKKWGVLIVHCDTKDDGKSSGSGKPHQLDADQERQLNEKFADVINDPLMKEVYASVKAFLQEKE